MAGLGFDDLALTTERPDWPDFWERVAGGLAHPVGVAKECGGKAFQGPARSGCKASELGQTAKTPACPSSGLDQFY